MKQAELSVKLDAALLESGIDHADDVAQRAICAAFRTLRDFLRAHLTDGRGIGGVVLRILFPRTAEGINAVAALLDDYLAAHCGA